MQIDTTHYHVQDSTIQDTTVDQILKKFPNLTSLFIVNCPQFTGQRLTQIHGNITTFSTYNTGINDYGLRQILKSFPNLKLLKLCQETKLLYLNSIQDPSQALQVIDFTGSKTHTIHIHRILDLCPKLQQAIYPDGSTIENEELKKRRYFASISHLFTGNPQEEFTSTSDTVTDQDLNKLLKSQSYFKCLKIINCPQVTGEQLNVSNENVQHVEIQSTSLTDSGFFQLLKCLPNLASCIIDSCPLTLLGYPITDLLRTHTSLKYIRLSSTEIGPQGLNYLLHLLPKLERLSLSGTSKLTDFKAVTQYHNRLTTIDITGISPMIADEEVEAVVKRCFQLVSCIIFSNGNALIIPEPLKLSVDEV